MKIVIFCSCVRLPEGPLCRFILLLGEWGFPHWIAIPNPNHRVTNPRSVGWSPGSTHLSIVSWWKTCETTHMGTTTRREPEACLGPGLQVLRARHLGNLDHTTSNKKQLPRPHVLGPGFSWNFWDTNGTRGFSGCPPREKLEFRWNIAIQNHPKKLQQLNKKHPRIMWNHQENMISIQYMGLSLQSENGVPQNHHHVRHVASWGCKNDYQTTPSVIYDIDGYINPVTTQWVSHQMHVLIMAKRTLKTHHILFAWYSMISHNVHPRNRQRDRERERSTVGQKYIEMP